MQALLFNGQELVYTADYEKPQLQPGEALIKVYYAGICNTDLEIMAGYKGFRGILGHEFVGVVEECEVAEYVGKRVVGDINLGCGECESCLEGCPNHCTNRKVLGIMGKAGAFADYLTLPIRNLYFVPDTVSDLQAVFAEPLAAALEILEQCHILPSHRVAIIGDGKLGQLIAQVLALTGCDLTVVGKHGEKLALLQHKAKTLLYPVGATLPKFDWVIECTGNESGFQYAKQLVKPRGRLILKSTFSKQSICIGVEWVVEELTLIGSRCGPIAGAVRLLERKLVEVEPLIGGIYPLAEWKDAFSGRHGLKVLFKL